MFYLYFLFCYCLIHVQKNKDEISVIKENRQDLEMISSYLEGYEALNKGDPFFAAKKFLEAELLFPQSEWAPRSALMASYSFYLQNYYTEALLNLERFLITYPNSNDLVLCTLFNCYVLL